MVSYLVSGLSVSSDIILPGLIALHATGGGKADVVIRKGPVPTTLDGATSGGPTWQLAGDRFLYCVPGVIRMLLTRGRELVYEAEGNGASSEEAIFISGPGFGILLQQRRRIVLHASSVRVGNGAVLFCGPSGAGKSTLAAALDQAGHDLVTDDFCGVSIDADGVGWVTPDGRQLKLWQNAIDRLALRNRTAARVRPSIEKYYIEPRAATAAALPLLAVYLLREALPTLTPGIARPNIVDASLIIRNNAYRPALVRHMAQRDLYFQAAAAIVQRAGVFTLTRQMTFGEMPAVVESLQAQWRELGLMDLAA